MSSKLNECGQIVPATTGPNGTYDATSRMQFVNLGRTSAPCDPPAPCPVREWSESADETGRWSLTIP